MAHDHGEATAAKMGSRVKVMRIVHAIHMTAASARDTNSLLGPAGSPGSGSLSCFPVWIFGMFF
jgi:hypothetical protein